MKVGAFINDDGGVSLIYPMANAQGKDEQSEAFLNRAYSQAAPGRTVVEVDDPEPRLGKKFRAAWELVNDQVVVNQTKMPTCIVKGLMVQRHFLLLQGETDGALIAAIGTEKERRDHEEYMKELRDFPNNVAQELSRLSVAEIEVYEPVWPMKG